MKSVILQISLLLLFYTESHSQKVILTAGKDASGSGGSVSYSIGQAIYHFNTGSSGTEAQGVQQAYEISEVQVIKNANILEKDKTISKSSTALITPGSYNVKFINLKFTAYPNPTIDILTLTIENIDTHNNLSYQLFGTNGKLIVHNKIENISTSIDMRYLVPATYILSVNKDNKSIKTFKIIKN